MICGLYYAFFHVFAERGQPAQRIQEVKDKKHAFKKEWIEFTQVFGWFLRKKSKQGTFGILSFREYASVVRFLAFGETLTLTCLPVFTCSARWD
jgi:hypothetical protein